MTSTPIRGVFVSTSTVASSEPNRLYGFVFANTGAAGLVTFRDGVSVGAPVEFQVPIGSSVATMVATNFGSNSVRFETGILVSCDTGITGTVFVG